MSAHNRYIFTRTSNFAPLLVALPTQLRVSREANETEWIIKVANVGKQTALFIWLEDSRQIGARGYAYFEDNHFSLFPNETKRVSISWKNIPESDRHITVDGWNTGTTRFSR